MSLRQLRREIEDRRAEIAPYRIPENWLGRTALILGTGPSLQKALTVLYDESVRDNTRAIAINDAYKVYPFADILYACDLKWWRWNKGATTFPGQRLTQDKEAAIHYELDWIPSVNRPGLSMDSTVIHQGCNSGYQALNIAMLKGAKKVILVGMDHKATSAKDSHFFGANPDNQVSDYKRWLRYNWPTVVPFIYEAGVDVVNCTPDSALREFRMGKLEDELAL